MKKRTPRMTGIENPLDANLLSISTIAFQIADDVEHLYGQKTQRGGARTNPRCATRISSPAETSQPLNSELILIATRTPHLREECQLRLVHHVACTLNKPVAIYSVSDSFIQFTRKLVNVIADIPSDAAIYDGKLSSVVRFVLHKLCEMIPVCRSMRVLSHSAFAGDFLV